MLTYRPVTEADLATLCTLPRTAEELFHCFPKARFPLTEDQLRAAIEQRADSTVVELDGRVVGFASFYQWAEGGTCAIGNVMVAADARRRGVASYLIRALCALAFDNYRADKVKVSCFDTNTAGLLLYPRLGFVPYAIEEQQDGNGERVALIHLRLIRNQALANQRGRLALECERMAGMRLWQRLLWAFRRFPAPPTPPEVREARRARRYRQALKKIASRAAGNDQG